MAAAAPQIISPTTPLSNPRQRWHELALVTTIAFADPLLGSLYYLLHGSNAPTSVWNFRWVHGLLQMFVCLALLRYVLQRSHRKFRDLGVSFKIKDVVTGLGLAMLAYFAYAIGTLLINLVVVKLGAQIAPSSNPWRGSWTMVAVPYILLAPFFEELLVRAYLMTEIVELTGSRLLAIGASTSLQAAYHLYYGTVTAASMLFLFGTFAVY